MDKELLANAIEKEENSKVNLKKQIEEIESIINDPFNDYHENDIMKVILRRSNEEIRKHEICIDALMIMVSYNQGEKLNSEQILKINNAINTGILSLPIIRYINQISIEYLGLEACNESAYIKLFSKESRKMTGHYRNQNIDPKAFDDFIKTLKKCTSTEFPLEIPFVKKK